MHIFALLYITAKASKYYLMAYWVVDFEITGAEIAQCIEKHLDGHFLHFNISKYSC